MPELHLAMVRCHNHPLGPWVITGLPRGHFGAVEVHRAEAHPGLVPVTHFGSTFRVRLNMGDAQTSPFMCEM
jgi:hypothetical protein